LVATPGYCMNVRTCRIAASGAAVKIALEDPFICPECGGSLAPPALNTIRPKGRIALVALVFVCVAIGAGATVLVRGGLFERPAPSATEPPPTVALLAPIVLAGPVTTVTQDTLADPPPAEAEDMPPASRVGRKAATRSAHGLASRDTAAAASPGRHHTNVHMSLSIPLVAGGQPDYPEQYEEDGRSGSVTVTCALQPEGTPTQCLTTRLDGGRIFDVSVHSWLELRDVRFQTARPRHRPPVHDVTLTVHFIGDGPQTEN
jgi:hypothetical protein